jgi:serine palmitoyltransferase
MYTRVRDIFNRPIASVPSSQFELAERLSDDYNWTYRLNTMIDFDSCSNNDFIPISYRYTDKTIAAINLGSYNYLGFAESAGPCANDAINAIKLYGISSCSTRLEIGMIIVFVLVFFLHAHKGKSVMSIAHETYIVFLDCFLS